MRELLTLGLFCAYLFFFGLGSMGLVGADEPRYAQIAREMLARHDWVTPMLNGAPWLEKPALYYWCALVSYKLFGVSDWAARVPSAVFATLMVFAIYGFMRRFRAGVQLDAALMAASSAAVIGFGRGASTDMLLAATFTAGMLAWFTWLRTTRRLWLALFYVCIALGTLAKGPVAPVLAGLVIVVFALVQGRSRPRADALQRVWRIVLGTLWWPGIVLFLAVALPWYVAVQRATPQFFHVFFLKHNLERFGTNLYRHKQPFWYYVPVFLLSTLPWTVFVIRAMFGKSSEFRVPSSEHSPESRVASPDHAPDGLRIFLLIWIVVPLVFFTISQSKLPGYILPAIPACALLLAEWLSSAFRAPSSETDPPANTERSAEPRAASREGNPRLGQNRARPGHPATAVIAGIHAAVNGTLLAAALLAPYAIVHLHAPARALLLAGLAGGVLAVAMWYWLRARGLAVLRFVTLVPVVVALAFIVRVSAPLVDRTQSARPVAEAIAELLGHDSQTSKTGSSGAPSGERMGHATPVAGFEIRRELEYGLDFYRNQPVMRYERGETPAGDHLVVARAGSEDKIAARVAPRRVSRVGRYEAQGLELYWVSAGMAHHH
ncbi:MAG: ArnT family glycosyltransferase [Terriglobales bacterium]